MITELQKKMWEEHVARRARMSVKKPPEEPPEPTVKQQEEASVAPPDDPIELYTNKVRLIDIQNLVAKHYGITRHDILSQRRQNKITMPRQVAYWLSKTTTLMSYSQIGRRFGPRDHTTIMHGVQKIERMMQSDENLRAEVEGLKNQIMEKQNGGEQNCPHSADD